MIAHHREILVGRWRALRQQWGAARDLWNDPVRQRFEREFWHEFEQTLPTVLDEMMRLAHVVEKARRQVK